MKIIVAGCGKVGRTLLRALSKDKHDLIAIDSSKKVIDLVKDSVDCLTYVGNISDVNSLREVKAENASILFAVTDDDEINLQACLIAKKMGTRHTVARIRETYNNDEENITFKKNLIGLSSVLNPESFTARSVFDILRTPFSTKVEVFGARRFEMIEFSVEKNSRLDGLTLSKFKTEEGRVLFGIVKRGDETIIPNGAFKLKANDTLGILVKDEDKDEIFEKLELDVKPIKNVIIVGGGLTTYYLAKELAKTRMHVTIIEKDRDKAKELSIKLPANIDVIFGDGLDKELLKEEGYNHCDAFICLTGIDEQNILAAYRAHKDGIKTVIAKVNNDELLDISKDMGVTAIVSPQVTVANAALKYTRAHTHTLGSKVETLYQIMENTAIAVEIIVDNGVVYHDKKLKELNLAPNTIIAGIIRDNEAIIPNGEDIINEGDRLIVITTNKLISGLGDVFVS